MLAGQEMRDAGQTRGCEKTPYLVMPWRSILLRALVPALCDKVAVGRVYGLFFAGNLREALSALWRGLRLSRRVLVPSSKDIPPAPDPSPRPPQGPPLFLALFKWHSYPGLLREETFNIFLIGSRASIMPHAYLLRQLHSVCLSKSRLFRAIQTTFWQC